MPAAVRPPHAAAARRVVLTLLFLGGFLALAFVLGGSAQAAPATDHDGRVASGAPSAALKSGKQAGPAGDSRSGPSGKTKHGLTEAEEAELAEQERSAARRAAARTASHAVGPVAEGAGRTAEVTRPVGDAVEGVTGAEGLHELPARLGLGELGDGVAGGGPGEGGGSAGSGEADDATGTAAGDASGDRANGPRTHGDWGIALGASLPGTATLTDADEGVPGSGGGGPSDRSPVHHTPAAPAPGTSQHAGDSQSQRGGPQQSDAVTSGAGKSGPLQPGAARAADGTPTRDRAGDVLEFPG
ncbi:hypothetical protein DB35_15730 [Streptomyces abyssalis]|uniref:Uncharacterized protein n=1 Tax=Streptomyces abyssalis TaxID=933944 RepID=A0A1E7JFS7_9ACTN|nr:hypothetical protein AN215_22280 [Streptomyces abyssalis]OEU91511.1 hypothetical protein DB35_15730 [Streptomyces abyssalis]